MRILRVEGGRRLCGQIRVGCAKNAVLPMLAASLLAGGPVRLSDAPDISDVEHMLEILRMLGCCAAREEGELRIDPSGLKEEALPDRLAKKLRSSIFLLGPMLGRLRRAVVTYPGGCDIGLRPSTCTCRACARWACGLTSATGRLSATAGPCTGARCILIIRAWARRKTS